MRRWLLVLVCLLIVDKVSALQIRSVVDNETTTAKVSSVDVTRIFVQGDRIKSVKGIKGAYTRENDDANGEIYIQPTPLYRSMAFTILIDTEQGRHFTLLLNPVSSPSETLMLVPKGVGRERAARFEQSTPYELTINHLVRAMKNGRIPEGYAVRHIDSKRTYQFGSKFNVTLKTIYDGLNLRGEIYEIENRQNNIIYLDEREFYKNGIRAVSLDAIVLQPKAKINLYRVVSHVR